MYYNWQNILKRIEKIKNPVGVEVGVHRGEMSARLLENRDDLLLYMVDMWSSETYSGIDDDAASPELVKKYQDECDDNYNAALSVAKKYNRGIVIKSDSVSAANIYPRLQFHFVYIDAAHDYKSVKRDIAAWRGKVKRGGWLCGHDYGVFPGVKKAVDEIFPDAEIDSDFTWFVKIK